MYMSAQTITMIFVCVTLIILMIPIYILGYKMGRRDEGEEWAEQMIRAIDANFDYACGFIKENFPGVKAMRSEGTYMLFLDCGDWCRAHGVSIGIVCMTVDYRYRLQELEHALSRMGFSEAPITKT